MDGWQETTCIFNGGGAKAPDVVLEHVVYDPFKELVWTGDSTGRVCSYYGPYLRPYTAFVAHNSPILALQVTDKLVWSLSKDGLKCHRRTGLVKISSNDVRGKHLLVSESELLVASETRVNRYNAETARETGTFAIDAPDGVEILFLRRSPPNICLGLSDGSIQIVDPQTFDTLQTVRCHTGPLTDLDCRKSLVMTCGMSSRRYGLVQDQIVYVYDSRAEKSLPLLPVSTGAQLVRMHPRSPTNCTVIGPTGQMHFLDAKNPGNIHIQQIAVSSELTGMDISPQGDSLVVIEKNGLIHFWTRNLPPDPNAVPQNLDLPAAPGTLPVMTDETPLSAVGLPYYKSELLSSWSEPLEFAVGMPPPRELSAKRNIATKYQSVLKTNRRSSVSAPRFISERERLGLEDDNNEHLFENDDSWVLGKVPRVYRQQHIQYSKFGVDDFNFRFFNKSKYSGLENQVPGNTYCNPLLQLLRWCAPIHNWALHKFAAYNHKPIPVLGEVATLFDMLHKAGSRQSRASNFLSMLAESPEALNMGLLDLNQPVSNKLLNLFQYLVTEMMSEEMEYTDSAKQSELATLTGISVTCRMYGTCGYRVDTVQPQVGLEAQSADHKGLSAAISKTTDSWLWCDKCQKTHSMAIVRQVTATSPVLFVAIPKTPPGTVPKSMAPASRFSLVPRADKRSFKVVDSETPDYVLDGYVAEVNDRGINHVVAIVNVDGEWHLFNDFLVTPISQAEALDFKHSWKQPVLLMYRRRDVAQDFDYSMWKQKLNTTLLYERMTVSGDRNGECAAQPLGPNEAKEGYLAALDAEFVLLGQEVAEIHSNGTKSLVSPRMLSLARVSVVRGTAPNEEVPFIDDVIETRQPVVDYLTLYSGIEMGDLDPEESRHALVTLRTAIRRLWLLLNLGCIFIGHALVNDFRTINLQIPPEQIIDTIDLYHDKQVNGPRKLSLKFLVWAVLGDQIQTGNHDSIEDAVSALRLYRKYINLKERGELESTLATVYALGQRTGFKVPVNPELMSRNL